MAELRVGEVIESSTTELVAQCYELYQSPSLGSLVKTTDNSVEVYSLVYQATTSSLEQGRRPIARGKEETSEEAIYRASPQLARLLCTEFSALVVGYRENGKLRQYLPPRPSRIHSFVYLCEPEEVREFGKSLEFLNTLLNSRLPVPVEEVVAASLRQMSLAHEDPRFFLVAAGKELAVQLGFEMNRLRAILGRVKV